MHFTRQGYNGVEALIPMGDFMDIVYYRRLICSDLSFVN